MNVSCFVFFSFWWTYSGGGGAGFMIGRRELFTFQGLWVLFLSTWYKWRRAGDSDIMVAASRAHVHTNAHTLPVNGMCPRKAGFEGVEEAELIRAEVAHSLGSHTSLTSSRLPSCHCCPQLTQEETQTHTKAHAHTNTLTYTHKETNTAPSNSVSLHDKFAKVILLEKWGLCV